MTSTEHTTSPVKLNLRLQCWSQAHLIIVAYIHTCEGHNTNYRSRSIYDSKTSRQKKSNI